MNNKYVQTGNVLELRSSTETADESIKEPTNESENESVDELAKFRQLVLGPALKRQAQLEAQLSEVQGQLNELYMSSQDCSQILPASINKLHDDNRTLTVELEPEISAGVHKCFKEQPEKMAEALYPVLGPALRKMVAGLFKRSEGDEVKPFDVEQLFLIHRETSLVLSHSILHEGAERDPDLVSGMLSAIRSFVEEAFALDEFDGMNSLELGDLTILVEWGPKAILAVVVRGFPDSAAKFHYAETLRQVHIQYAEELRDCMGSDDAFSALDIGEISRNCKVESQVSKPAKPFFTMTRVLCIVALGIFFTEHYVSHHRLWGRSLSMLSREPGVVVINADAALFFKSRLLLLRDPRSASAASILERAKINLEDTSVKWYLFQSQDPTLTGDFGKGRSTFNAVNTEASGKVGQALVASESEK